MVKNDQKKNKQTAPFLPDDHDTISVHNLRNERGQEGENASFCCVPGVLNSPSLHLMYYSTECARRASFLPLQNIYFKRATFSKERFKVS